MPVDLLEPIPLDKAVLCESCRCITDSQGETCSYCKSVGTLMSLAKILDRPPLMISEPMDNDRGSK